MANEINEVELTNNILQTGIGATVTHKGVKAGIGIQTFYHGTAKKNLDSILKNGLDPAYGGTGAANLSEGYKARSKGKVHLTKFPFMSSTIGAFHEGRMPTGESMRNTKSLKVHLPYNIAKHLIKDPDMTPAGTSDFFGKLMGVTSSKKIDPKYISYTARPSVYLEALKGLPTYIKERPIKSTVGVTAAIGGTMLAINGIKKLKEQFTKTAESNYALDFLAGADPTGRATLELSKKNEKNHTAHKFFANAGGFIAGSAATTAITAAGMYGAGKLLKKTPYGEGLAHAAKEMLITLHPKKTYDALKRFGPAKELFKKDYKNMKEVQDIYETTNETIKATKNKMFDKINFDKLKETARMAFGKKKGIDDNLAAAKAFKEKHGIDHITALQQGGAAIAGLSSAAIGGGMNALSSQSQYNVGQDFKKEIDKNKMLNKKAQLKEETVTNALNKVRTLLTETKGTAPRAKRLDLIMKENLFQRYKDKYYRKPHVNYLNT